MLDSDEGRKGGFGAFAALFRMRQAARRAAQARTKPDAATLRPAGPAGVERAPDTGESPRNASADPARAPEGTSDPT